MYIIIVDNTNYQKRRRFPRLKYMGLLILAGISALACPVLGLLGARSLFIDPRGQGYDCLVLACLCSGGLALSLFLYAQYMKGGRKDGPEK